MKPVFSVKWNILLLTVAVFYSENLYAQNDFIKLHQATDSTFGYTAENPIKLKKGNPKKSIQNTHKFLAGLTTNDNQTLTLIKRSSLPSPSYKEPAIKITDRTTHMPLSGNLGMLDKYIFITSSTKDTITLYVDIYNKGELFLPAGLKYE